MPPAVSATSPTIWDSLSEVLASRSIIDRQCKLLIKIDDDGHKKMLHVEDFVGLYPSWPIIELAISLIDNTKDDRMNHFVKCCASLFAEILYVDDTAAFAPIEITDNRKDSYITDKASLPANFTKLGKWIMISGGSWVFDKKEKGSNDERFHLKSQVVADDIINQVSFEFTCPGGSKINKKPMQAMETETPMMLLFVCNSTNQGSFTTDIKQMLEIAHENIDVEGMMPKEYKIRDTPIFPLRLNIPRLPEKKSAQDNRAYDHICEQGKKAFHLEVAKPDIPFFAFFACHAHRMKLDIKYFGKFTKLTATLGNNTPLSNCNHLRQCIQGHLNFHLSSISIMINGINNLNSSETLRNMANGSKIACLSLRDMLYCIQLANKSPLFLQLSQRSSGEVDAAIPNRPEVELMAKWINVQVAAWCHFYWNATNTGGERFYRKLSDRAFSLVLLHEISKCVRDAEEMSMTSPNAQSELSAVMEFKHQDWVKNIAQADQHNLKKKHVDPNAAFPFQDDCSVGTIHGKNMATQSKDQADGMGTKDTTKFIKISDTDNDISVLTFKMHGKLLTLLVQERRKSKSAAGNRDASGSMPLVSSLTANATPTGATGTGPDAAERSSIPSSAGTKRRVDGRPGGK
jgi:hypothetical protein